MKRINNIIAEKEDTFSWYFNTMNLNILFSDQLANNDFDNFAHELIESDFNQLKIYNKGIFNCLYNC